MHYKTARFHTHAPSGYIYFNKSCARGSRHRLSRYCHASSHLVFCIMQESGSWAMSGWKQHPLLLQLKAADEQLSSGLFLASNNGSPLAHYRPTMQMLEYSAHGIPWLLVTCLLIWFVTDRDLEAFYVNLLIGACYSAVLKLHV